MISILTISLISCDAGNEEKVYNRATGKRIYLNHALDAAEWIISTSVEHKDGSKIWPDDTEKPDEITFGISSGVAGKVLFFLELYNSTNDVKFLQEVKTGADHLLAAIPLNQADADTFKNPQSLYGGLSGIGFTLNETYKVTQDQAYRDGALKAAEWLHKLNKEEENKASWGTNYDVMSGNAGAGLFLLYVSSQTAQTEYLIGATHVGDALLAHSLSEHDGLTWKRGSRFILPNFSHGAAGIGYFLASLYQQTGEVRFLEASLKVAKYLDAIAKTDDGVYMIPYGFPDIGWGTPYDIGWAHGPAGAVRFFYRLAEITGDDKWLERVWQGAEGIQKSGLPGASSGKDYGENPFKMDMRFGQASVARFFLDLYKESKNNKYKLYGKILVDDILKKGVKDTDGLHWPMDRYNFMPYGGEPADFTGYFYGAAGYGLMLLHMDAVGNGANPSIILPDNPFH